MNLLSILFSIFALLFTGVFAISEDIVRHSLNTMIFVFTLFSVLLSICFLFLSWLKTCRDAVQWLFVLGNGTPVLPKSS